MKLINLFLIPSSLAQMLTNIKSTPGEVLSFVESINQYGCWCYFDKDYANALKSATMDDLDSICKTSYQNYECATLESEENDEICTPWEAKYATPMPITFSVMHLMMTDDLIESWCLMVNGNTMSCGTRACIVETKFIADVTKWRHSGGVPASERYSAVHGDFKPGQACLGAAAIAAMSENKVVARQFEEAVSTLLQSRPAASSSISTSGTGSFPPGIVSGPSPTVCTDTSKKCCGQWPVKFAYTPNCDQRQCCGTKTYNSVTLSCCDESNSVTSASCVAA